MEKVYRILFAGWLFSFMAAVITATSSLRQPPMITKFTQKDLINPKDVTDFFALPCEASGTNLTWTWKHNDKQITDLNGKPYSLSKNGTLIGKSLAPILGGTYQCFVKDEATGVEVFSRKLQVTVTVAGTFTDRTDVVKMVDLGQPFQFQCPQHTAGFGATYNWFGELSDIALARNERRGISPKGTLFISHVTQQDISDIEGLKRIKCRMMAGHFYYDSGTLKLQKKNPDPNTPFKPYWADYPQAEEIAIEGRSKTLYCFAMGRPAPNITWKKNGREIIHGQNSFEIPKPYYGRLLNITNVDKTSHQDVYSCEAENSQNKDQPLVHRINLVVKVPPKWTKGLPPRKIDVIIRRNKTLECKVTADPEAKITWYKNGKPLQHLSDRLKVFGNKLHLINVSLTDDGVYQCAAENKYKMIVSATWVHVNVPPRLITKPRNKTVIEHKSVTFHCNATGNPTPKITWTKDGKTVGTGSELTFVALRSDAGRYWCSADIGLNAGVKADAYLRVLTVPFPPTDVKISDCSNWTAKISWVPVPSDDVPITHYLIEQQSDENPVVFKLLLNVTDPSTTSVALNLTGSSVLRFRVKAVNSVGASRPSLTMCGSLKKLPSYHKAWFVAILALAAFVLLFAFLAVLHRKYKGKGEKYYVGKRERKRGLRDELPQTEEEIGEEERNSLVVDAGFKPPEEKQEPDRRSRPITTYSMSEVQFKEDGSFTEEYGDGDEMIQNNLGTDV
ncbi:hypothetical protein ACROYT_G032993 [Oculina patagonica]